MHRPSWLFLVALFACDISTNVGDLPAETTTDLDDHPSGDAGTSTGTPPLDGVPSSDAGTSTGTPSAEATADTRFSETEGTTQTTDEFVCDPGDPRYNCPPAPEDWCSAGDEDVSSLPPELVAFWNQSCAPTLCVIEGEIVDNCSAPPEDWCGLENRDEFPLPEGLSAFWDTYCDESSTGETTDATGSLDTPPPGPCIINGESLEPCPLPPTDWCDLEDRDAFVLPDGLAEFWDSTCEGSTGTTGDTSSG